MQTRIVKTQYEVLYTDYFFVNAPKLFERCKWYGESRKKNGFNLESFDHDWNRYYFGGRRLALAAELRQGPVGIEGEFELAIPAAKEDVDTFGYSISKGELDRWDFLRLSAVPEGDHKISLVLSFARNSFFDRAQDVIQKFDSKLIDKEEEAITGSFGLQGAWDGLWRILKRTLEAERADQSLDDLRQRVRRLIPLSEPSSE